MRTAIFLLFLISFGCAKGQAFLEVGNISDNNGLLIVPMRPIISELGSSEDFMIPEPILIDNPATIESIVSNWGTIKSGHPGFPFYKVVLIENNEILRTVSLNGELTGMFTSQGFYEFNKEELFQYEDEFKYPKWLNIKVKSVEESRKLIEAISSQKFIYSEFIYPNGDFRNFSGEISLHISTKKDVDDYELLLRRELNDSSIILTRSSDLGKDSANLTIRTMSDITPSLPSDYTLSSNWTKYKNIEFEIVGIEKDKVISIATELGIKAEVK